MFRLIKWLIFILIIGAVVMYFTETKYKGKTIQEHAAPILNGPFLKEGIKDVRALLGEGLKAAGEAISEDVTDVDKKKLEEVLKKELAEGKTIEGVLGQKALPPDFKTIKPLDDKAPPSENLKTK